MDSISTRPARESDLETLLRFQRGIVDAERPYDPTLAEGGIRYYDIEALIRADNVRFLIAEREMLPIGCGFARLQDAKPYVKHRREAYLGLMYVEPAFRGQGVNSRLLTELSEWCLGQGVMELRLDVYPDNASARRAYEKAGFRPHLLEMRQLLTPEGD